MFTLSQLEKAVRSGRTITTDRISGGKYIAKMGKNADGSDNGIEAVAASGGRFAFGVAENVLANGLQRWAIMNGLCEFGADGLVKLADDNLATVAAITEKFGQVNVANLVKAVRRYFSALKNGGLVGFDGRDVNEDVCVRFASGFAVAVVNRRGGNMEFSRPTADDKATVAAEITARLNERLATEAAAAAAKLERAARRAAAAAA